MTGLALSWNSHRLMFLQAVLVVMVSTVTIAAPPAEGAMLIVPVKPQSLQQVMNWALGAGGQLVAIGPVRGSLIVFGQRARLIPAALANGSVLIAAPASMCGSGARAR